ncbi:MAG: hypothetical protein LBT59_11960, partial [Clostridiales bacterium]|nr:hypothetical protein [Clostridiales bacterium]
AAGTVLGVGDWSLTLKSNVTSYCLLLPGIANGQSYAVTANGSTIANVTATTTIQGMMMGRGGMGGGGDIGGNPGMGGGGRR